MQIVIKSAAGVQTILCDGPVRDVGKLCGPVGVAQNNERRVEIKPYFRGPRARPIDRGNGVETLEFAVTRLCANPANALSWRLWFFANCVRSGTLFFTEPSDAGVAHVALADAVIRSIKAPVSDGVHLELSFVIVGSQYVGA